MKLISNLFIGVTFFVLISSVSLLIVKKDDKGKISSNDNIPNRTKDNEKSSNLVEIDNNNDQKKIENSSSKLETKDIQSNKIKTNEEPKTENTIEKKLDKVEKDVGILTVNRKNTKKEDPKPADTKPKDTEQPKENSYGSKKCQENLVFNIIKNDCIKVLDDYQ